MPQKSGFLIAIERGELRPAELPDDYRRADIPTVPVGESLPELLAVFPLKVTRRVVLTCSGVGAAVYSRVSE